MCDRFFLGRRTMEIAEALGLQAPRDVDRWWPHYNISPGTDILALLNLPDRPLETVRWGLIPGSAKVPAIGYTMINARSESIAVRPVFRLAFLRRRCIIPADGFFEWKTDGKVKQPFAIRLKSKEPLAMAGIWERWKDPKGNEVRSTAIITTSPNALMEKIHDRMPVILARDTWQKWLDPEEVKPEYLQDLLKPYPAEEMEAWPISALVNSPKNDGPEVLEPV